MTGNITASTTINIGSSGVPINNIYGSTITVGTLAATSTSSVIGAGTVPFNAVYTTHISSTNTGADSLYLGQGSQSTSVFLDFTTSAGGTGSGISFTENNNTGAPIVGLGATISPFYLTGNVFDVTVYNSGVSPYSFVPIEVSYNTLHVAGTIIAGHLGSAPQLELPTPLTSCSGQPSGTVVAIGWVSGTTPGTATVCP
jgi:hypothetical protein